jgi:hypothetical protein
LLQSFNYYKGRFVALYEVHWFNKTQL